MDEGEFPANSRTKKPRPPNEATEEKVVIEKVVTGDVIRRKKPLGKRFLSLFVSGDGKSVWQYVMFDVLIPAAKDVFADAVSQGVERMIFGESRSASRRTGSRPEKSHGGYVSYNRYSSTSRTPPWQRESNRDEPRNLSRRARAAHNFDEIILPTRGEAEEVIDQIEGLITKYNQASVSDMYSLVGITGDFTDEEWGWTELRGAGVRRVTGGYLLVLPRPEPID